MTLLPLRAHQHEMLQAGYAASADGARSVILQAPPGFGKTHMAAHALDDEIRAGGRAIFLFGLDTIGADTFGRLAGAGLDVGRVHAGQLAKPSARIQVCSWHTLRARGERPPADLVIVDEVHHAAATTLQEILGDYPRARLLGLSGTPERGDGAALGDTFQVLVPGPQPRWLIDRGYLVPYQVLEPVVPDGTIADPVHAYFDFTPFSRAIVFTDRVETARELMLRYEDRGVCAAVLSADTPSEERQAQREDMTAGHLRVLINVAVATEGFDLPCIETVILARRFGFVGTYLQAVGRGGRPSPETGKNACTVIDCAGNWRDHGLPDEDRVWSLTGQAARRTEQMPAIAKCKVCGAIFRPQQLCPRCGANLTGAESVERVKRKLSRAETALRVSGLPQWEQDARYLTRLAAIAMERMRMSPQRAREWAHHRFLITRKRQPTMRPDAA